VVAICDEEQITCFADDKVVATLTTPSFALPDPMLDLSMSDVNEHTLKDFLKRPILIDSPTWGTAAAMGAVINAYNFPESLLSNTMYASKITNFYGFRASMVFRVVINCERFQQGRLILTWFPQGQVNTDKYAQANSHIMYSTQLPRVDFDVSVDTAVTLKVPYASPFSHYCTTTGVGPFGVATLMVYSPLKTPTGTNNLAVQLWAWCEDIELAYPARPQSRGVVSSRRNIMRGNSNEEVSNPELKTVAHTLGAGASAILKANVPLLSSIMSIPSWVSDFARGVAYSYGASKPLNSTPPTKMCQENFGGHCNVDYVDNAANLGLSSQNSITPLSRFVGSEEDEMSLQSVLKIPTYYKNANWSVDQVEDAIIFNTAISPASFYESATWSTIGYAHTTPLSYYAQAFECWRGSLNFTFKFTKTEFHSGRLLFTFDPGPATGNVTIANSCSLYREIIDVRLCNEYTVTVPYVSIRPWLRTTEFSGSAWLIVESKLRAPTTVNPYITILMEVSAGPDFEFSMPRGISTVPVVPGLTPALKLIDEEIAVPEALGMDVAGETNSSRVGQESPLGVAPIIGNANSAICIGETVTSLRQILKKYCSYFYTESDAAGIEFKPSLIRINPFPAILNITPANPIDYIDYFGLCYGYQRGGIRIRGTALLASSVIKHWVTTLTPCADGYSSPHLLTNGTLVFDEPVRNCVIHSEIPNNGYQLQIPFYSTTHCKMNKMHAYDTSIAYNEYEPGTKIQITASQASMSHSRVFRAAADDFSFGFFLCTVPLVEGTAYVPDTHKFIYA
jgi:hypothetical protein